MRNFSLTGIFNRASDFYRSVTERAQGFCTGIGTTDEDQVQLNEEANQRESNGHNQKNKHLNGLSNLHSSRNEAMIFRRKLGLTSRTFTESAQKKEIDDDDLLEIENPEIDVKDSDICKAPEFEKLATQLPDQCLNKRYVYNKLDGEVETLNYLAHQCVVDIPRNNISIGERKYHKNVFTDTKKNQEAEELPRKDILNMVCSDLHRLCNGDEKFLNFVSKYFNHSMSSPIVTMLQNGRLVIHGLKAGAGGLFETERSKDRKDDHEWRMHAEAGKDGSVNIKYCLEYPRIKGISTSIEDADYTKLDPEKSNATFSYAINIRPSSDNANCPFTVSLLERLKYRIDVKTQEAD